MSEIPKHHPIILFDGYCNLCNSSIQWIIKRDKKALFRFTALQSEIAESLLDKTNPLESNIQSIILIEGVKVFSQSEAIIRIASHLGWFWSLANIFLLVPKSLRDIVYNFIAKNRYRWFGKRDSCMLPAGDVLSRFLQ